MLDPQPRFSGFAACRSAVVLRSVWPNLRFQRSAGPWGRRRSTSATRCLLRSLAIAGLIAFSVGSPGIARPGSLEERRTTGAPSPKEGAVEAADAYLRHLYSVYLSIRGCTEASRELNKAEFMPTVSFGDARRIMRNVDIAAKEVGIDTDRLWVEIGPLGLITAEAVKKDTPTNLALCARVGSVFRIDLGNLQNVLVALGSKRALIEKDF